jgi:FHA domain
MTTTHDADRGGNPRLILAMGAYPREGDRPTVFQLLDDVTTIGAGADCDIRLPGLEPLHAEIRHDDEEEFVLKQIGSTTDTRVHGAPVQSAILRTGCGVDLGEWHLPFFREEYADHDRPYGGRLGGELAHQRSQPIRASVQRHVQGQR